MAGVPYWNFVVDVLGNALSGASVAVCTENADTSTQPGSTLADIFADKALTIPIPNPMTTNVFGRFQFYAALGAYQVQVYGIGVATPFVIPIFLGTPAGDNIAAGSAGQVQFNGSPLLGADANLFWDNTDKRLGIGTASPAVALDVVGTINASVGINLGGDALAAADLADGVTGSGAIVLASSPTLVAPTLGAAIATSLKTALLFPPSDSATAFEIDKADGSTPVVIVDTTNSLLIAKSGLQASRFKPNQGTVYSGADVAVVLGANWGTIATVSAAKGYDQALQFTVNSSGASIFANPTITITFKDGTWTNAPLAIAVQNGGGTGDVALVTCTTTATTVVITWNGLPVTGKSYVFTVFVMGI